MGFFDKLFGGKSKDENTAKFTNQSKTVLTPLQGKVLAQADIPDETFAQGILGPGCGIEPTGDTVYAPFDGTVTQIATTLHAVGITSNDGIELLIHVGMDTVDMKGQGFTVLVKENQKVTAGTPLLKVDLDAIRAAGIWMPVDVGIMPILDQAATINMALSRNGCVMPRKLCEIISKHWIFPNPFAPNESEESIAAKKAAFKEVGLEYTVKLIDEYRVCGIAGIHLYALNKYEDVARLVEMAGIKDM